MMKRKEMVSLNKSYLPWDSEQLKADAHSKSAHRFSDSNHVSMLVCSMASVNHGD